MARKYLNIASLAVALLALSPASAMAAKKAQTITVEAKAPATATVGSTYHWVAKASSGLPVSVNTEESPSICSVSESTVTFKAEGTCHIDFNQAGDKEYEAAPEVKEFTKVTKRSQTIKFTSTAPTGARIGGPTYTVSASASSGLAVSFASATTSVCTVSGSTVSFVGAGTCTIDANQAGNGEWAPAPQATQSFSVARRTQTTAFTSTAPGNATIAGPTYTVSASASSGLAVAFTSASEGVCKVSGSTVSFVGAGTCTIDANQSGNAEYEPAPQVAQSFSVAKRAQTVTITSSPPAKPTVGETYAVSATASSGLPVSFSSATTKVCTVSGSTVSFVAAGGCSIRASQGGNAEYEPAAETTQGFEIAKRSQTVAFTSSAPANATVGGGTYAVSAVASSGLPVSFSSATPSVCTVSGSTVSFVGAGTCTIDANQAGNGEYQAAPQAQQSFSVAKGSQTITITSKAPEGAKVGDTYTIAATGGGSGNPVTYSAPSNGSACSVSGATVKMIGAGTCTIDADQAGSKDYEAAPTAMQSFAVAKKTQTVSITSTAPSNAAVGGPTYTLTATATSGLAVESFASATPTTCTVSGSTVSFVGAGTCTITAEQAGNGEYEPAKSSPQSFPVGKGSQTIAFTSSASNPAVGGAYEVAATGGKSGEPVTFRIDETSATICSIEGAKVSFKATGTCRIDANQPGNANYEAAPQVQQVIKVVKGAQTITFSSTPPSPANPGGKYAVLVSASSGLPVVLTTSTPACAVSGMTVRFVEPGECVILANQAGNENYEPAPQELQKFPVGASVPQVIEVPVKETPSKTPPPIEHVEGPPLPNNSFKVIGASLSLTTYAISFQEAVVDPGTFTWVMTFENGKYGVYASKAKRCKAGFVRLKGKCRPAKILFARGSETVATAGAVTFMVHPTRSGIAAMKNAFKHHKGLPVTALVTFQSARGGPPASRVQSLVVKGRR